MRRLVSFNFMLVYGLQNCSTIIVAIAATVPMPLSTTKNSENVQFLRSWTIKTIQS